MEGFLGTGATFLADLNLMVQISMGVALLIGMILARRKRYSAHKFCQSSVILLNLVMIGLMMAPSFRHQVASQIPAGLGNSYNAMVTVHAVLGAVAELLGLYIVLAAATNLVPQRLRFKQWKLWMRTALALWWAVLLFGVGSYYLWYLAPSGLAELQRAAVSADRVTIKLADFEFSPKVVTAMAGTIVEWTNKKGRYTVEADDGSFKSPHLMRASDLSTNSISRGSSPIIVVFTVTRAAEGWPAWSKCCRVQSSEAWDTSARYLFLPYFRVMSGGTHSADSSCACNRAPGTHNTAPIP